MRMRRFASLSSLRFAFGENVTLSTSTHRHYDESVHRIKQLTRGNNTIGFSDILSRIRNSTTTGIAIQNPDSYRNAIATALRKGTKR